MKHVRNYIKYNVKNIDSNVSYNDENKNPADGFVFKSKNMIELFIENKL